MSFELPDLPYATDALQPYIDQKTMEIHHGKHHASYVKKLNQALEGNPNLLKMSLPELLKDNCAAAPKELRTAVRNNGGGHANHTLFWTIMSPNAGGEVYGPLGNEIRQVFGSFESFQERFNQAALSRFGSGWAWLAADQDGSVSVISTPNQDSPLMEGRVPLMGIDVWEHAYYLKYQNRRADYVTAWWNLINWENVAARFDALKSGELESVEVLA